MYSGLLGYILGIAAGAAVIGFGCGMIFGVRLNWPVTAWKVGGWIIFLGGVIIAGTMYGAGGAPDGASSHGESAPPAAPRRYSRNGG
jgi:hypothetical protein